jgi:hypothetical protein
MISGGAVPALIASSARHPDATPHRLTFADALDRHRPLESLIRFRWAGAPHSPFGVSKNRTRSAHR